MNDKTKDPLARWWWPGQWLHIVYGVWIDQLWYWKNIRPLLTKANWKQARILFAQATLGTVLILLVTLIPISGILIASEVPVNWSLFLIIAIIGVIGYASISMPLMGVARALPWTVTGGSFLGLFVGFLGGLDQNTLTSLIVLFAVMVAALAGAVSGLNRGIVNGQRSNLWYSVGIWFFLLTVVGILTQNIWGGISLGIIFGALRVLGNYWATRQVQDELVRQRLANPDDSR